MSEPNENGVALDAEVFLPEPEVEAVQAEAVPAEAAPAAEVPAEAAAPAPKRRGRKPAAGAANAGNVGRSIVSENDMVKALTPEDRRANDIEEVRRAIQQKNILAAEIHAVEPMGDDDAKIIAHRNSLKVIFDAGKDFFKYSYGMENLPTEDKKTRQTHLLRKARQMTEAVVTFVPLQLIVDEETGAPVVLASRARAMEIQRMRYFLGRKPVASVNDRCVASVLSVGPRYAIVEACGVETTLGNSQLSAFEYVEDCSEFVHNGDGVEVMISAMEVDKESGKIALRLSRAELERRTTPLESVKSIKEGGVYVATVLAVTERHYRLVIHGFKVVGYVSRAKNISSEVLKPGDTVNLMVYGQDLEHNCVWGACIKK